MPTAQMDGHRGALIYIQRNAFLDKFLESFGLGEKLVVAYRQFHQQVTSLLVALTVRVNPVSFWMAVTSAFVTAAPLASVTVPRTTAVICCAEALAPDKITSARRHTRLTRFFIRFSSFWLDDVYFVCCDNRTGLTRSRRPGNPRPN
jgi:hypothetical protein